MGRTVGKASRRKRERAKPPVIDYLARLRGGLCLNCGERRDGEVWCRSCTHKARLHVRHLFGRPWTQWPVYAGCDLDAYVNALRQWAREGSS